MEKVKATCAIIVNNKNELLLIKRGREPFAGYWALISGIGGTKNGLSPEKAVLSEVECDLQTSFTGKLLFTVPIQNDQYIHETIVFVGQIDESKIMINPPFSVEYSWFSFDEIDNLGRLAYEHNDIINKYLRGKTIEKNII